jgi:hypothetical protein
VVFDIKKVFAKGKALLKKTIMANEIGTFFPETYVGILEAESQKYAFDVHIYPCHHTA